LAGAVLLIVRGDVLVARALAVLLVDRVELGFFLVGAPVVHLVFLLLVIILRRDPLTILYLLEVHFFLLLLLGHEDVLLDGGHEGLVFTHLLKCLANVLQQEKLWVIGA